MLLSLPKNYVLPLVSTIVSFALFQLALHDPINARTFSSLQTGQVLSASEFDGVYINILARLVDSVLGYAELTLRLLTALATGVSVYFIQKLFPRENDWSFVFVIANISFLYFALHSFGAMLTVMWFAAFLIVLTSEGRHRLAMAGIIATIGLGIDSLVAAALAIYVLIRIISAEDVTKHNATALASTLLGGIVWVLLAYMLYGSPDLSTALVSGFQGMFKQINPINFGVGLVVTFNLLLVWVFRSPTETTTAKYLGSLLIVLFLLVKAEPVYMVLMLIAGVWYLSNTGGLPRQKWTLPLYSALNILAFMILPSVRPLEALYNVRAERPSELAAYSSYYFARHMPSYQSLIAKANTLEALVNLRYEKVNTDVVLDPATASSLDWSALRDRREARMIGGFEAQSRRFKTVFGRDTSMMQVGKGTTYIRYIATESLPTPIDSLLAAANTPRADRNGLRFYTIDSTQYATFFNAYIYHHYLSYH